MADPILSSSILPRGVPVQHVLGVDGGGSKTEVWLSARRGSASAPTRIGRGSAGPSNPQVVGLETAQRNIGIARERAFADAELPVHSVAAACLALAGVGREPLRQQVLDWAEASDVAGRVRVVHDAQAVLAAGTEDGTGVAVICGTGSFAFGEAASGCQARCGGWGYLFGDEGSGYGIGSAALRAVARAADGRGQATQMTAIVLEQLQLNEPAQLIPTIFDAASIRPLIAAIAPCVFHAADQGDEVARQICRHAGDELAQLVCSIARQLDFGQGNFDLALAGGVVVHQSALVQLTMTALRVRCCEPRCTHVVQDPVSGSVRLAWRALQ